MITTTRPSLFTQPEGRLQPTRTQSPQPEGRTPDRCLAIMRAESAQPQGRPPWRIAPGSLRSEPGTVYFHDKEGQSLLGQPETI